MAETMAEMLPLLKMFQLYDEANMINVQMYEQEIVDREKAEQDAITLEEERKAEKRRKSLLTVCLVRVFRV